MAPTKKRRSSSSSSSSTSQSVLKYLSDDLRCRVQIDGSKLGFFDIGWLEVRRVQRHSYATSWENVVEVDETVRHTALLVGKPRGADSSNSGANQLLKASAATLFVHVTALEHARHALQPLIEVAAALSHLQAACTHTAEVRLLTICTQPAGGQARYACSAGPWGLARTVRQEVPFFQRLQGKAATQECETREKGREVQRDDGW